MMREKRRSPRRAVVCIGAVLLVSAGTAFAQQSGSSWRYEEELDRLLANYNAVRSEFLLLEQEYSRIKKAYDELLAGCTDSSSRFSRDREELLLRLSDSQKRMEVLEREVESLRREKVSVSDALKECKISQLEGRQETARLGSEAASVREEVSVCEQEREELGQRIEALKTEVKVCELQLQGAVNEVADREKSIESVSLLLRQKEDLLQKQAKENAQLKQELAVSLQSIDTLRDTQVKLQSRIMAQEEKVKLLIETAGQLRREKEALIRESEGLRAQLLLKDTTLQDHSGELRQREQELSGLKQMLLERDELITELRSGSAGLQKSLEELSTEHQAVLARSRESETLAASRQSEIEGLRQKLNELLELDEAAKAETAELKLKNAQQRDELARKDEQIAPLENKARMLSLVIEEKDATIRKLSEAWQQLPAASGQEGAHPKTGEAVIEQGMAQAKERMQDLEEKNQLLTKENKGFKQKIDQFTTKFAKTARLQERLRKENAVLHYNMGVIYLQRYEYENAVTELQKALELNPGDPATHYNLGLIYAEYLDDKAKAISHFKRYLELDPDDQDAQKAKKYIVTWETWVDEPLHIKH